ncbi:J domain-containing protein [Leptolyngbya ohadii]|uniref:J domain-containing protein n=1 Tax=Leptolyngbya ohadii TaxID=1962290 RepID=UPI000B598787|nr:DnaJ domain-containing protein [Leptolyngbya ohadii]
MAKVNHYDTLELSPSASQAEIKQAYRRLAKQFHPDVNPEAAGHDRIAQINAAYEVLGDPRQRQSYDRQMSYGQTERFDPRAETQRSQRAAAAQRQHQKRQTGQDNDIELQLWLKKVYQPVNRMLNRILGSLREQINALAADPFDDELLEEFQAYLEDCRSDLQQAQRSFRSLPNPPSVAGVAAHLYYCLNQVSDGLDELERFVTSYDDHYLHTGQELFRIAKGLKREAQAAIKEVTR